MIIVSEVLGNIRKDAIWKERLKGTHPDYLILEHTQLNRECHSKSTHGGLKLIIYMRDEQQLEDGDVLIWDDETNNSVIVKVIFHDVMVINLQRLLSASSDIVIHHAFSLGHRLGERKLQAIIKNNLVYVPITIASNTIDAMMKKNSFQPLSYWYVNGDDITSLLTIHEIDILLVRLPLTNK